MDFVKYLNLNPVLISADDLVELSSKNDSILDYELFKKTDQVDSFLRQVSLVSRMIIVFFKEIVFWQELNSVYDEATTTSLINDRNVSQPSPVSTLSSQISEISSGLFCFVVKPIVINQLTPQTSSCQTPSHWTCQTARKLERH